MADPQQPPQDKYTVAQVIAALRAANGIKAAAARVLGCEWRTVDNYIKRYPTVRAALDECDQIILDIAEGHLISDVRRGQWEQIKYYLNAKGKSRGYGTERRELTGAEGAPLMPPAARTVIIEIPANEHLGAGE
jgi:hypothetical protein